MGWRRKTLTPTTLLTNVKLIARITDVSMMSVNWIYIILLVCSAYDITDAHAPTISVPIVPTSTMAPKPKYNFTLKLGYTGPACLDSIIAFSAKLYDNSGHSVQSISFNYEWMNNANHSYEYSTGRYHSSLSKTFTSKNIVPGQYIMTVSVYGDEGNKRIVAYSSMKFILTENLNGNLRVNQSLPYQRNSSVFSTKHPILFNLNIKDRFDHRATIQYFWYRNKSFDVSTSTPNHSMSFDIDGNHTIEAVVHVLFLYRHNNHTRRIQYHPPLKLVAESCQHISEETEKCAHYTQKITTKDRLTVLDINGDTSVAVNSIIQLNVSCIGSAPTGVCWNITALNRTSIVDNVTCMPRLFRNTTCFHQISVIPEKKGWHDVHIAVYNDVSYMRGNYYVFAYDAGGKHSSMVTIPVAFSLLVAVIIIISGVYIWKLRKKPYIEVADFEFHPSISRNDSWEMVANTLTKMKLFFKRRTTTLSVNSGDSGDGSVSVSGSTSQYDQIS